MTIALPPAFDLGFSPRGVASVELGNDPPLDFAGTSEAPERQAVSLRWLAGSVLTALGGGSLIAAALVLSMEGSDVVTERAQTGASAARPAGTPASASRTARKENKLVRPTDVIGARQAYKSPMNLRVGEREVIKVRSFVRVATAMSTAAGPFAQQVPSFNPLKMMGETQTAQREQEAPVEASEAEVALAKSDLSLVAFNGGDGPSLSDADVLSQVGEERRAILESGRRPYLPTPGQVMLTRTLRAPLPAGDLLAYAPEPSGRPFSTIEVRVVPENVTVLEKREIDPSEPQIEEKRTIVRRNESIETVLRAHGASPDDVRSLVAALAGRGRQAPVIEGREIRVMTESLPRGRSRVLRVAIQDQQAVESIAAIDDQGAYVSVTPPTEPRGRRATRTVQPDDEEEDGSGIRLYESFYETALSHRIPANVINELVRVFANDIDFQRRADAEDTFEAFFTDDDGELDLLYAAITVGGETRRYFRFSQTEDGVTDYFDEQGRSARKFLLPKPVEAGEFRSGFGSRRHPILGYSRMHNGVDWAAPSGTRIFAAGSGTIVGAGWDSGYGRRVEIEHANGWKTTYSHMSGFAAGIKDGGKIRQGQLIGFMGSSGLSTGTHLHYEVLINDRYVDPLRIRTPRSRELSGRALAEFKRNREQVEALIEKAPGNAPRTVARATP